MPAQILVVEDEQIVAMDIQQTLVSLGYDVPITVATGEAAVEQARQRRPDLVLMDIRLGGEMDGVEAAGRIRELGLPVIFLTAHADPATLARAKITEPFGYVLKPFEERDLHTTIEMALYKHATEQKLLEADRRKDEFLGMLGHELRNPLAAILNAVEVLRHPGHAPSDPAAMLAAIGRQAAHMGRIVDDLLDITRITHGKFALKKTLLDVVQLARDAAEDHRRAIESQGAALHVDLPDAPLVCQADPTRLAQVLDNLLNNSAKFLGGPGEVRLSVREQSNEGQVEIRVRDSGIGMDEHTLRDVFEPFVQAAQYLDRASGGLGLGLALVRGLVELHGGRITATSPGLGQGAEFTIHLPLDPQPIVAAAPAPLVPVAKLSRRILLIDDHDDARFTIKKIIELGGHEVVTAGNAADGLSLAREQLPEVVLCDIGLPGMDGYEFAVALRSEPALARAYLVAISGYGLDDDRMRARQAGFDNHLTKPVTREHLERLLASLPRFSGTASS